MWELLGGTVLGLGSALIVSKSDSLRRRRDAASLVRLKLEAWADHVELDTQAVRRQEAVQSDNEALLFLGGTLQKRRPQIGSLFESSLAELMGFHEELDEHLIGFHERATEAEQRFAEITQRHGPSAFQDRAAERDFRWAAAAMQASARHAIRASVYLEDLFSASSEARWKRLWAVVRRYSGPPPRKELEAADRISDLMMTPKPTEEESGED